VTQDLEFRVLGTLEVTVGARRVRLPKGNQRTLLASLILQVNQEVLVDNLVCNVWGESLPQHPRNALHICVTRLRQTFESAGVCLSEVLHTTPAGYELTADPAAVDFLRFRRFVAAADAAAEKGDTLAEHDSLCAALSLWRGEPLSDVRSETLHRSLVPTLEEEWGRVAERRLALQIDLGRHAQVIGELRSLTGRHPFREQFWQLLISALYRSGRQAEALDAYRRITTLLKEELGIEPGQELQNSYLMVLRNGSAANP
jgi:DNA-binding SARP family transcriptional activator